MRASRPIRSRTPVDDGAEGCAARWWVRAPWERLRRGVGGKNLRCGTIFGLIGGAGFVFSGAADFPRQCPVCGSFGCALAHTLARLE
jgi:hypothetical protein